MNNLRLLQYLMIWVQKKRTEVGENVENILYNAMHYATVEESVTNELVS